MRSVASRRKMRARRSLAHPSGDLQREVKVPELADVNPPRVRLSWMDIRAERQQNAVADEVSALVAVVRPILMGLLWALKADVSDEVGGRENVKLKMLARLRRRGDGDCGICFEYAVHDAMRRGDAMVVERV